MGVNWTKDQQKVIDLRNRNILVSAAAGSGKTAVLVERIITMITDKKHPVDIDHLLIVTFTKAAAGEMRERIMAAIDKKREKFPEDVHIERQMTLIHNAQITTIDSFCQYVIRNYFHTIGLDPGFRIADEGELKLLKSDVAEQLIEDCYGKKEERFLRFVECYATGKNDKEIEELIFTLYHFSMSYPWPQKWLQGCKEAYKLRDISEFLDAQWMQCLLASLRRMLGDVKARQEDALEIALSEDGPYMYEDALRGDGEIIEKLLKAEGYLEYSQAFAQMGKYARLSPKKDDKVSDARKDQVKALREQMKKSLKALQEQYFYASPDEILCDMQQSREVMEELIDLTCEFSERFAKKKRERNLLDFSDLEHFALDILVRDEEGQAIPSPVSQQLAGYYEEILIDEYQDSNFVQELILTSISKKCMGQNNLFMVGDVKQSIYRFRLARPELFMEKYESYPVEDGDCQRIDLHMNFRSRRQVLSSVNFLFDQIMAKYLGNIQYGQEVALYPGAGFPEGNREEFTATEVILVDLDNTDELLVDVEENARELEARAVGGRILEIVGKEQVLDKATGTYRPARYSDMVILLRTISGWADTFAGILGEQGIPAYTGSQTGYFSTVEIQTILSLLKVIDNPRQEIPMTAVLRSPMVNLTPQDLAIIKSEYPQLPFYEACRIYANIQEEEQHFTNPNTGERLKGFYRLLDEFRSLVPYTPMHELLWQVLDLTGYGDWVSAMPGGEQRAANLKMLIEKAMTYETTSYRGLFNFIRYIENLQKYHVDFGEAGIIGEQENTVRIMSIHKSKGLEFPIVFVSGMGKSFNQQDSRSKLLLHPDLGIGCDFVDPKLRIKSPTLLKKAIQRETINENLGEELRVLYVAFTRAKEKLILTGAASKLGDKVQRWSQVCQREEVKLSFSELAGAGTYLDWIVPSLLRHRSAAGLLETFGLPCSFTNPLYEADTRFEIIICPVKSLVREEAAHEMSGAVSRQELLERLKNGQSELTGSAQELNRPDAKACSEKVCDFRQRMEMQYQYARDADIHGKITVSEIKKYSQSMDNEDSLVLLSEPEIVPIVPKFMQSEIQASGAIRGTAYHKLLEELDFTSDKPLTLDILKIQISGLIHSGKMTSEEAELIDLSKMVYFTASPLGTRMAQASRLGNLHREQQFVLGVPASSIRQEWNPKEMVLVQGIIDAFFYEGDEIVLVDYKTDYVPQGNGDILIRKYKIQLDYYAEALERLTEKSVKEKVLYSFWLGKGLPVNGNN